MILFNGFSVFSQYPLVTEAASHKRKAIIPETLTTRSGRVAGSTSTVALH